MELLRFLTCGSVDDGKSTLIGRMLYDSNTLQLDLLEAIQESSRKNGKEGLDLSLLTDGLKSEREQGITIDVAYKYFSTEKRKFIIADTPGHIQYTRNMVTGASTSDLAILLVDARHGIVEQTRRHTLIVSLLEIPHLIFAVNKMDLVSYKEERFLEIQKDIEALLKSMQENFHFHQNSLFTSSLTYIPVSALQGDNVVKASQKMPWYQGKTLLEYLDTIETENKQDSTALRFPVQMVIRPQSKVFQDYRAYSGQIRGGTLEKGQKIKILPSGHESTVTEIGLGTKKFQKASAPMSINILLKDEIDISRGDLIVNIGQEPTSSMEFTATICWMTKDVLKKNAKYLILHNHNTIPILIKDILYKIDLHRISKNEKSNELVLNDLGLIQIQSQKPLYFDSYACNRNTGSFILMDPSSFSTLGAGMIS